MGTAPLCLADAAAPGPASPSGGHLGMADMACAFDVSPRALRSYEERGLLTP